VDLTSEDKITDEAVRAAAEAIEDETFRRIGPGRNLDDIHREGIARAALLAALPLLGTAWPGDRVECADCGRTSGYCKCGDIDAAEMARLMRERVLRESAQDECSGYEDFVADGPDEVVLPLVTAAAAEKIAEARYRAGREDAARAVERFGAELSCHECGPDVEGFVAAARGDQPRTLSGCDGEDNPEEQAPIDMGYMSLPVETQRALEIAARSAAQDNPEEQR
jgi:hypothetical protein